VVPSSFIKIFVYIFRFQISGFRLPSEEGNIALLEINCWKLLLLLAASK